jgi:hypothetical protein
MAPIEEDCVRLIEQRYQEDLIKLKMKLCREKDNNYYYMKECVLNGRNE